MFTVQDIMNILPHRCPFLLVDRVVEWEPGTRIVAIKNVTINEPFFPGHFPGHPIMPGVLIIEALAQAGGFLALKEVGGEGRVAYFAAIDNCRFRRPVFPGDQLRLEVTTVARKGLVWKMHGEAFVEGVLAVRADLTATIPDALNEKPAEGGGQ